MIGRISAALILALFLTPQALADGFLSQLPEGGAPHLPLDDRAYRDVLRLAVKGELPLDLITNRPATNGLNLEEEVRREYLSPLHRRVTEKGDSLKKASRFLHFYSNRGKDGSRFVFDPRFSVRIDQNDDVSVIRRKSGIRFAGSVKSTVGYYFRFVDNTERGGGPYSSRSQLIEDHYGYVGPLFGGRETYYDQTEAYINLSNRWVNVTFGKDRLAWGPALGGNLLLSGESPSFDQLRIKVRTSENTRFTYLAGKLHPSLDIPGDSVYQTAEGWVRYALDPKWIAAHRFEYAPTSWALFSVSEAVIWGERDLDAAYLNPLYFLYSAEHDGGDRDNVLMSGDFIIRIPRYGVLYAALLIDDLKISKLGKGYAGNKLGGLAGVYLCDIGMRNLDGGVEYTRIEPYVYSHFFPINRFSTWTSSLGSDLPPNSDRLKATLQYKPYNSLTILATAAIVRHGTIGGTINEPILPSDMGPVHFLDGNRDRWFSWSGVIEWEPIPGGVGSLGVLKGEKFTGMADRIFVSLGYHI